MAITVNDCGIKPVCNDGELTGVEDARRQQSIDIGLAPEPGYLPFAEKCEYQRVCVAPKPKGNPLFRPPEPSTAGPADEPAAAKEETEPKAFDTDRPIDEIGADVLKVMDEFDSNGAITGADVSAADDGTARLKIHHISPKTMDAMTEAAAGNTGSDEVYESLEADIEYLEEIANQAMNKLGLPDGWWVEVGDQEINWDNGVFKPEENCTTTFKLIPPEE